MGGLRRARRGRSAEAAHPADHADQDAGPARGRLHRYLAASQGSDQPLRELRRRQLPEEVARTDPAQPRRLTRPDGRAGRERGRGTAHRDALPAAGNAAHAGLPGADQRPYVRHPAAARRAGRRPGQGGRRPDAGRPGDHPLHRGLRQRRRRPAVPDARGARRRLRRPVLRRRRGHHPRGARLPQHPGRVRRVPIFLWPADRSVLSWWVFGGGGAGRPFSVVIDPGGPNERVVDALADAEPVRAGEVIRIRTTGGGGWGGPLERPYDEVLRDVRWGKVSVDGARDDYGVVIAGDVVDEAASDALRAARRAELTGPRPFFDRGPGYAVLAGRAHADVDFL